MGWLSDGIKKLASDTAKKAEDIVETAKTDIKDDIQDVKKIASKGTEYIEDLVTISPIPAVYNQITGQSYRTKNAIEDLVGPVPPDVTDDFNSLKNFATTSTHFVEDLVLVSPGPALYNQVTGQSYRTKNAVKDLGTTVGAAFPEIPKLVGDVKEGVEISAVLLLAGGALLLYVLFENRTSVFKVSKKVASTAARIVVPI